VDQHHDLASLKTHTFNSEFHQKRHYMSTVFELSVSEDVPTTAAISPLEAELLRIWRDVLEIPDMGLYDDFFELGGHSLLSIEIRARVRKALEVAFVRVDVLSTPTVALMARSILEQLSSASVETSDSAGVTA
jgi:hypothetical protein